MDQASPTPVREFKYFTIIGGLFVATLLISGTTASKLATFGPLTLSAATIIFPVAFIFGDILTEVYGYARSRQIVWTGFAAEILMAIFYVLIIALPPASFWTGQAAFEAVLGQVPRIVVASILAYLCGEFANSYVLAKMKVRTNGKHLWMRTIGSTLVGEGVDSIVFITIAFLGTAEPMFLVKTALSIYVFKVCYEILATPLVYLIVHHLKKVEGVDHYDRDTNFNPFKLGSKGEKSV